MPIFEYNLIVWSTDFRESLDDDINSIFRIFLKRWLGVPYATRTAMVHFLTQTTPLVHTLLERAEEQRQKINNINLSLNLKHEDLLVVTDRTRKVLEPYKAVELIPSGFWMSEVLKNFPSGFSYRRKVCQRIVDSEHWKICKSNNFHTHFEDSNCKCISCEEPCSWFHKCETPFVWQPCSHGFWPDGRKFIIIIIIRSFKFY